MCYYPEPDSEITDIVIVEFEMDLSNYATKNKLEHATGILIHLI